MSAKPVDRAADLPARPGSPARRGLAILRQPDLLSLPVLVLLAAVFVYPVGQFLSLSVFDSSLTGAHYRKVFETPGYLRVLATTIKVSLIVTGISFILAYPVAYLIATGKRSWAAPLLALVIVPFWTSVLVRNYAWMVLLGRRGVLNEFLLGTGLIEQPLQLIYNTLGVCISMVNVLLPFMVLVLYSAMRRIDLNLIKAAQNLGAGPLRAFWHVFFPLSLPGVVAGSILVFVTALGFFVTPALIGGRQDTMIVMLIEDQVRIYLNWGFASALAVVLLITTFLLLGFSRVIVSGRSVISRKRI